MGAPREAAGTKIARISYFACLLGSVAAAQVTQRVSLRTTGSQVNDGFVYAVAVSGTGRYVAFASSASTLVPNDTNGTADIFLRDRETGATELVSVDSGANQADGESARVAISPDGRYVAFGSRATNLAPGDTNGVFDAFVRDRRSGTTERVSLGATGGQGVFPAYPAGISPDGRYVLFLTASPYLVAGDSNYYTDVFVRDRAAGTTEWISRPLAGGQSNNPSEYASMSADGRVVVFASFATNLVNDTNYVMDVFVRDLHLGTLERVSVGPGGVEANGGSGRCSISADGRYVAFQSSATNLVLPSTYGEGQIYVVDRYLGALELASVSDGGFQGNGDSDAPAIAADGRSVAFQSLATHLDYGDGNGSVDVFVRDLDAGTTEIASVSSRGFVGNFGSDAPSISGDGRCIAFRSAATDLVPDDTNGIGDVYLLDRSGRPSFEFVCEPGVAGVIACPCGNPPNGPRRGCDNSYGSGGARLYAQGGTFVSSDTLLLQVHDYGRDRLRFFLQGSTTIPSGRVYGQGVRCAGGRILRLYTRSGPWRYFSVPSYEAGELPVTARSAALGDEIHPGETRAYFVSYRDPVVPAGCPATSTFNATQTGIVTWSP